MTTKNNIKIGFILDTSSAVGFDQFDDVVVLPLSITTKTDKIMHVHRDCIDIDKSSLNEYFLAGADIKTSQCSLSCMIDAVEEMIEKYDEVWVLPIHSRLSGNINSWNMLSEEYDQLKIIPVDNVSVGINMALETIREVISSKPDITAEEVCDTFKVEKTKYTAWLIVNDLSQLIKGGRISNFKGSLGKMLKVKPIIRADFNGLNLEHKVKSVDDYLKYCSEQLVLFGEPKVLNICVPTLNKESDDNFIKKVKSVFPNVKTNVTTCPTVIEAHVGMDYFALHFTFR